MKNMLLAGVAALTMAACTTTERNIGTGAAVGAAAGAVIGGVATDSVEGAVAGAAIGAASGAIIGAVADRPGYCYARDHHGRRIVVECPPGY